MDKRDEFDKLMLTYFEAFIDEDELKDKLFALIDQPAPDLSDEKDKEIAKLTEQLTFALGDCERLEEALENAVDLSGVVKVCPECKGEKTVLRDFFFDWPEDEDDQPDKEMPCPKCSGTGRVPVAPGEVEEHLAEYLYAHWWGSTERKPWIEAAKCVKEKYCERAKGILAFFYPRKEGK